MASPTTSTATRSPTSIRRFIPTCFNTRVLAWAADLRAQLRRIPTATCGIGLLAFPYIFPGAYSQPQVLSDRPVRLDPLARLARGQRPRPANSYQFDTSSPLDLPAEHQPQPARPGRQPARSRQQPDPDRDPPPATRPGGASRPGVRRSPSTGTIRPVQVNDDVSFTPAFGQSNGLSPRGRRTPSRSAERSVLPWMSTSGDDGQSGLLPNGYRLLDRPANTPQLFSDGPGVQTNTSVFFSGTAAAVPTPLWS